MNAVVTYNWNCFGIAQTFNQEVKNLRLITRVIDSAVIKPGPRSISPGLVMHVWESAGQSDWPEKICVVLLPKKRRRPVSFRHEEKRFSLWTAPCLSIKSGVYRVTYAIFRLPSLIIL